ncbi:MAG: glycosyltransferase family 2 protein [Candidatus Omnitrophica bacterium]|nr:glycosyltransferase family 2 protein [Candidatus Omnitrophota bacterium]
MKDDFHLSKRAFEIAPAFISWSILLIFVLFSFLRPKVYALLIISFDIFWVIRVGYLTSLLAIAHRRLNKEKNKNWWNLCIRLSDTRREKMSQAIIFPVYKEGLDVLVPSLEALKNTNYPKEKMIVVLAFEDRVKDSREKAKALESRYKDCFLIYLSTFHPETIPGEARTKGANATWAAKILKGFLDRRDIRYEDVIVSCFDADTCVEKEYFGCLLYHFLTTDKPFQCSYQPIPVYNNNIWYAPSFARIIEITASYCQLIDSMRLEKFVTFSSHSMSFKTLIDVDYWPVDKVSDDSLIYWKAYLYFNGDYRVVPMYITVSMDVAYGKNSLQTLVIQYKQKRRWAWGIEVFPFVMLSFRENKFIPLGIKIRKAFHILDSHISWATWAIILAMISPLAIILSSPLNLFKGAVIGFNLPRITGVLFNLTNITVLLWMALSFTFLPPKPKELKFRARIKIVTQWLLAPIIMTIIGSTPALDAQTRLALGRYMEFSYTEKNRKALEKPELSK